MILVLFGWMIRMVKKNKLALKYALPWMGVMVCLLALDIFPEMVHVISKLMGIALPINMLMFLGLFFVLVICFYLTVHVSKQTNEIRLLSQEVALLREELERKEKE